MKASEARTSGAWSSASPPSIPETSAATAAQCAVERAYHSSSLPPRRSQNSPAEAYSRFAASRPAASVAAPTPAAALAAASGLGRTTSCNSLTSGAGPACASVHTRRSTAAELRSSDPAAAAASIAACSRATPPPLAAAHASSSAAVSAQPASSSGGSTCSLSTARWPAAVLASPCTLAAINASAAAFRRANIRASAPSPPSSPISASPSSAPPPRTQCGK